MTVRDERTSQRRVDPSSHQPRLFAPESLHGVRHSRRRLRRAPHAHHGRHRHERHRPRLRRRGEDEHDEPPRGCAPPLRARARSDRSRPKKAAAGRRPEASRDRRPSSRRSLLSRRLLLDARDDDD
eukprot:31387-Pelagococcus_subviridis.AAC.14